MRLEANGVVRKAELKAHPEAGPDASGAIAQHRDVWLAETTGFVSTPIYARERLRPGNRFAGPAIVEQMDATTLVPPGMTARGRPLAQPDPGASWQLTSEERA